MDQQNPEKQSLTSEEVILKPECMFCGQEKIGEKLKKFRCMCILESFLSFVRSLDL